MKSIYRKYFSCEHFAKAMCQRKDCKLSFKNKFLYWLHYLMCFTCRRVNKQIDVIDSKLADLTCCDGEAKEINKCSKERMRVIVNSQISVKSGHKH